jgi:hypothetical protein
VSRAQFDFAADRGLSGFGRDDHDAQLDREREDAVERRLAAHDRHEYAVTYFEGGTKRAKWVPALRPDQMTVGELEACGLNPDGNRCRIPDWLDKAPAAGFDDEFDIAADAMLSPDDGGDR